VGALRAPGARHRDVFDFELGADGAGGDRGPRCRTRTDPDTFFGPSWRALRQPSRRQVHGVIRRCIPVAPEQSFIPAQGAHADPAAAALRELPEALIFVFDSELRSRLTAGQALARLGEGAWREGQPLAGALPPEVWRQAEPLLRSALRGETRSREIWTAGQRHCLTLDAGPLRATDADGVEAPVAEGVAVVLDITARRQADLLSRQPPGGFEEVFEHAPIGTGLLDRDGRWLLVNRALCEITGYTSEELIGKRFDGIIHPDDVYNHRARQQQLLAGEIPAFQVEKRYFDAAGETVAAIVSASLVRDGAGEPLHYIVQLQDISERRELEEHLRHLGDHDPLTGLRNRRLFEHDLRLQIARAHRYGEIAGLMLIDLDDFGRLNERHGQRVGDATLRAVARALTRRLRETDLVARVGGDQFAVLLPHIDGDGLTVVADGLTRVIPACTIDAGEDALHPSASIGCALIDQHSGSARQAMATAERALRAVKRDKPREL
jgi:diguanylate cyclase (GGDEF)-like protein/PAS domain S-box-containing protein